jgi:hypothetical protein
METPRVAAHDIPSTDAGQGRSDTPPDSPRDHALSGRPSHAFQRRAANPGTRQNLFDALPPLG